MAESEFSDLESSLADCERVELYRADRAERLLILARLYVQRGELDGAERDFLRALEMTPVYLLCHCSHSPDDERFVIGF